MQSFEEFLTSRRGVDGPLERSRSAQTSVAPLPGGGMRHLAALDDMKLLRKRSNSSSSAAGADSAHLQQRQPLGDAASGDWTDKHTGTAVARTSAVAGAAAASRQASHVSRLAAGRSSSMLRPDAVPAASAEAHATWTLSSAASTPQHSARHIRSGVSGASSGISTTPASRSQSMKRQQQTPPSPRLPGAVGGPLQPLSVADALPSPRSSRAAAAAAVNAPAAQSSGSYAQPMAASSRRYAAAGPGPALYWQQAAQTASCSMPEAAAVAAAVVSERAFTSQLSRASTSSQASRAAALQSVQQQQAQLSQLMQQRRERQLQKQLSQASQQSQLVQQPHPQQPHHQQQRQQTHQAAGDNNDPSSDPAQQVAAPAAAGVSLEGLQQQLRSIQASYTAAFGAHAPAEPETAREHDGHQGQQHQEPPAQLCVAASSLASSLATSLTLPPQASADMEITLSGAAAAPQAACGQSRAAAMAPAAMALQARPVDSAPAARCASTRPTTGTCSSSCSADGSSDDGSADAVLAGHASLDEGRQPPGLWEPTDGSSAGDSQRCSAHTADRGVATAGSRRGNGSSTASAQVQPPKPVAGYSSTLRLNLKGQQQPKSQLASGDANNSAMLMAARQHAKQLQQQNDALVRVLEREREQQQRARQQAADASMELREARAEWEVSLQALSQDKAELTSRLRKAVAGEQEELLDAYDAALAASAATVQEAQAAAAALAGQLCETELQLQQLQHSIATTTLGGVACSGPGPRSAAAAAAHAQTAAGSRSLSRGRGTTEAAAGLDSSVCCSKGLRALRQHMKQLEQQAAQQQEQLSQLTRSNTNLLRYKRQYEAASLSLQKAAAAREAAEAAAQQAGLRAAAAAAMADQLEQQVKGLRQEQVQTAAARSDMQEQLAFFQQQLQQLQQGARISSAISHRGAGDASLAGAAPPASPHNSPVKQLHQTSRKDSSRIASDSAVMADGLVAGTMQESGVATVTEGAAASAASSPTKLLKHSSSWGASAPSHGTQQLGGKPGASAASSPARQLFHSLTAPAPARTRSDVGDASGAALALAQQVSEALPAGCELQGSLASLMQAIAAGAEERRALAAQGKMLLGLVVGQQP